MSLDPSQILNNMKRSFNVYLENGLSPTPVNYDEDPFDTSDLTSWVAVRYGGYSTEPTGMGDLIDEGTSERGRFHILKCEVSAWRREDPQRAGLGGLIDELVALCEAPSVPFHDYADPENPVDIGTIRLKPVRGSFTPRW